MSFVQTVIFITGALAIWLVGSGEFTTRRWAYPIALVGQPFWIYEAYTARQWGLFALSFIYLFSWARGAWVHWRRNA